MMRSAAFTLSFLIWTSSTGLAGATTCYQGATTVHDVSSDRAVRAVLSLSLSARDDEVSRIRLTGRRLEAGSTLFCNEGPPIVCRLEEDGGRVTFLSNGPSLRMMSAGRLQINQPGDHVSVSSRGERETIVLHRISANRCGRLFPGTNKIIVEDPPSYDSDER